MIFSEITFNNNRKHSLQAGSLKNLYSKLTQFIEGREELIARIRIYEERDIEIITQEELEKKFKH